MADQKNQTGPDGADRRTFLEKVSKGAMAAGLVGGYGGLGAVALRYLYPARPDELSWQFVVEVDEMDVGASILYQGPSGETINVARQRREGGAEDFVALSSTCPHLGCKVEWMREEQQFFCPCHRGVFDADGRAISGPPADADQNLFAAPLIVDEENGVVFIEVRVPKRRKA